MVRGIREIHIILTKVVDETPESLEKRTAETIASYSINQIPDPKSVTYTDFEDPFSMVMESSAAPHISKLSKYAWVGCGGDIYVLDCLGKGYIRIEPVKGENMFSIAVCYVFIECCHRIRSPFRSPLYPRHA
jgi:hypothetical protein